MAFRGESLNEGVAFTGWRPSRWGSLALAVAAILFVGLVVLPWVYGGVVRLTTPGVVVFDRPLELHILANCASNMLVMIVAWGLSGRLDRRLAALLNIILVAHGLLALIIVLSHSYYSNRVMIAAAVASCVLGLIVIAANSRFVSPRIALIGPWHTVAGQIGFPIDYVEDPSADLRRYDLVLTTFTGALPPEWAHALARALLAGKPIRHAAEFLEETRGVVSIEHFDLEHLPDGGLSSYRIGKRAMDLLLLAVCLPAGLVLLAFGSLAVLLFMGRPVFFVQPRVGFGGEVFNMIKLRTMRHAPSDGTSVATVQGDARVTRLGGFLRRFRIDEIPQFWNVAIGDMSFIGPRPEQPGLTERYVRDVPAFAYRQLVRPGISGWAQVRAGYAADLEETKVKLGYDLFYLKYFSFGLDLQIMLRTLWTLVAGGGVR